jgi:parallel beta-helix repeat protein
VTGVAAGSATITATSEGKSGTASVAVTAAPPSLVRIILSPDTATVYAGKTTPFSVSGKYSDSSVAPVSATFTATGGTITATGLYTAGQTTGTFHVIATSTTRALADTSAVTIQLAPLAQLILVPALATVPVGGSAQFQVYGRTAAGDSVAAQATYSATGGVISSAGFYTAGSTPGTFQAVARQTNGTLADTSAVTITPSTSCVSSATMLCPGDDIQAKATAAGPGATLTLQPGVYRMQTVVPLNNQTFVGQPGAIMSGAKLLTGWTQSGATWYVSGQTQKFADNVGVCAGTYPCQPQEDVYRDNALLTRVLSQGAVVPGTFFFDYTAQRIYVGDDPTGHVLEAAATEYAFEGSPQGVGTGVTITGLIVEKYATPAQYGAVGHSNMGANWVVKNSEIRYNHGGGIRGGAGVVVAHNFVHHNGEIGAIGYFARVDSNEIAANNTAHFAADWEGGGTKFVSTQNLIVRGNFVHHNHGRGLWTDSNNDGVTYDGNTVEDNEWDGIMHEISYSATITNNVISRNGALNPNSAEGAGIMIMASGGTGIDVSGNTLTGNKNGIILIQSSRGTGSLGPYVVQNVTVHNNTVTLGHGQRHGAYSYGGDTGLWTTNHNQFNNDTYNLQTADAAPFLFTNNALLSDTQWKAAGNDLTGTFNH